MSTVWPTSFRLPKGTVERIDALARPNESRSAVLLRAIDALENTQVPPGADSMEALAEEVENIRADIDEIKRWIERSPF